MSAEVITQTRGIVLAAMIATTSVVARAQLVAPGQAKVVPASTAQLITRDRQILRAELGVLLAVKALGLVDEERIVQWVVELTFEHPHSHCQSGRWTWRSHR